MPSTRKSAFDAFMYSPPFATLCNAFLLFVFDYVNHPVYTVMPNSFQSSHQQSTKVHLRSAGSVTLRAQSALYMPASCVFGGYRDGPVAGPWLKARGHLAIGCMLLEMNRNILHEAGRTTETWLEECSSLARDITTERFIASMMITALQSILADW